jgi:hypothetical protein
MMRKPPTIAIAKAAIIAFILKLKKNNGAPSAPDTIVAIIRE